MDFAPIHSNEGRKDERTKSYEYSIVGVFAHCCRPVFGWLGFPPKGSSQLSLFRGRPPPLPPKNKRLAKQSRGLPLGFPSKTTEKIVPTPNKGRAAHLGRTSLPNSSAPRRGPACRRRFSACRSATVCLGDVSRAEVGGALSHECKELAVAQKTGTKMGCPGKWKHGPKPAVCPPCLILSHTQLTSSWVRAQNPGPRRKP